MQESASDMGPVTIGPSYLMFFSRILLNPAMWVSALICVWNFVPGVAIGIYHALEETAAVGFYLSAYRLQAGIGLKWIALGLLLVIVGYAFLRQLTTRYEVKEGFIVITEGILTQVSDSTAKALVFDCDITRNPVQGLLGTGDLVVRTVDQHVYRLRFVHHPEHWRDVILDGSGARHARMLGTI